MSHRGKHKLHYTVRASAMTDQWYRDILFNHKEDGFGMLLDILRNSDLQYLDHEMEEHKTKGIDRFTLQVNRKYTNCIFLIQASEGETISIRSYC